MRKTFYLTIFVALILLVTGCGSDSLVETERVSPSSFFPTSGPNSIVNQCNTTAECRVIYGNQVTDCASSQSDQRICMCGTNKCFGGDPKSISAGELDAGSNAKVGTNHTLTLSPTLPSGASNIKWALADGPGRAIFDNTNDGNSDVSFSWPGNYTLVLSANIDGEDQEDRLNVTVSNYSMKATRHSALERLNPSIYFPFDDAPTAEPDGKQIAATPSVVGYLAGDSRPSSVAGAKGDAWNFGDGESWLRVYGGPSYDIGKVDNRSGISMSFWVKHQYNNIEDRNDRIAGSIIDITLDRWGGEEGRVNFCLADYACYPVARGDVNPLDGHWRHVVLSVDFKSDENNIRIYLDGEESGTYSADIDKNFNGSRSDKHLVIGTRHVNPRNHLFRGSLDDFAVFDYPLNHDHARHLFQYSPGVVSDFLTRIDAGKTISQDISNLSVNLAGIVENNDPNAPEFATRWRLVNGPSNVDITNPNSVNTRVFIDTPPEGRYHEYVFELAVDEGYGFIHTDQVSVVLYPSRDRSAYTPNPAPPVGVHPRILIAPEDLPDIRSRYASGINAGIARDEVNRLLYGTLFNESSDIGRAYSSLVSGNLNINFNAVIDDLNVSRYGDGQNKMYSKLMAAGLIALINEDAKQGRDLATALTNFVRVHRERFDINLSGYLHHQANPDLALAYDFLYPWMSVSQRQTVRAFIAHVCSYRRAFGTGEIDQGNSTNWRAHHDHVVICALGIEGEEGYDSNVYESNVERLRRFNTRYGVHDSGKPHEELGYFTFGQIWASRSALATAMRDENFFETTSLFELNEVFLRQASPWGDLIFDHDDSVAGVLHFMSPSDWITKYMYPDDLTVDFRTKVLMGATLRTNEKRKVLLSAILFGLDIEYPDAGISFAGQQYNLPLSFFDSDVGYLNTRTAWSSEATKVEFRSKQDVFFLGHIHSDRNTFEIQSHGRDWIVDPGKFMDANDYSQTILIDGMGQSNSEAKRRWPPMPGVFVDYIDTPFATLGSGDAKANYDFHRKVGVTGDTYVDSPYTWADFTFNKDNLPSWFHETKVDSSGGKLAQYNPVEKAFRTLLLVRGEHPYILVIDDIEKDNNTHHYEWVANMANDFHSLDYETVELLTASKSEALVRYVDDTEEGTPRFLLKVLQADGEASTIELKRRDNLGQGRKYERKWLSVERDNIVNPNFKMLLYPHMDGDLLPTSAWEDGRLTIRIGEQVDQILFDNSSPRTRLSISRNGVTLVDNR